MTNVKACISDKDEKLYTLDVFIDSVSLSAEKVAKISPNELGVDLQFIDVTLFRIFQSDFLLTKPDRPKEMIREGGMITIFFNTGKMYLFTRHSGELIEKMRSKPILLDVYRIKEIKICPEEVIKDPLGNSRIPLPGCLCDYVMMASNDIYHLPKSYEIKNTFGLVNDELKPVGYISIFFRLTCFGTYMIGSFSLMGGKLLFTNAGSFNEFLCTKVLYPDEEERRAAEASAKFCLQIKTFEESELDSCPRPVNVAGLFFACKHLSMSDGFPANINHPNYPPIIPVEHVEEIPFDMERARRKGFEQVAEEESEIMLNTVVGSHRTCVHVGCAGNICSGKK